MRKPSQTLLSLASTPSAVHAFSLLSCSRKTLLNRYWQVRHSARVPEAAAATTGEEEEEAAEVVVVVAVEADFAPPDKRVTSTWASPLRKEEKEERER